MQVSCQQCRALYNIPENKLAQNERKLKCKKCSGVVIIPASKPEQADDDQLEMLENSKETIKQDKATSLADIDALSVSDTWKSKFKVLREAGADYQSFNKYTRSKDFRALSFKERFKMTRKITFNFLAFIFGIFYYFTKKMWLKGAVLAGMISLSNLLLLTIETLANISIPVMFYWIPGAAFCMQMASYDYYRHILHQDKMWQPFKIFLNPVLALLFAILPIVLMLGMPYVYTAGVPKCGSEPAVALVKEITVQELGSTTRKIDFSIDNIRTQNTNQQTGAHKCAADVNATFDNGNTRTIPIEYTVEQLHSDQSIYISVSGLSWR